MKVKASVRKPQPIQNHWVGFLETCKDRPAQVKFAHPKGDWTFGIAAFVCYTKSAN